MISVNNTQSKVCWREERLLVRTFSCFKFRVVCEVYVCVCGTTFGWKSEKV
jgi:hypothetical protein